jgi:flagellar export protein FliJ
MKRFRFPLQPVATLRDRQEMLARQQFARAVQEAARCAAALDDATARVDALVAALLDGRAGRHGGAVHAAHLAAHQLEVQAAARAAAALAAAEHARETARQRWLEARLQVRLIENLRERARTRHLAETFRAEQVQLDERAPRDSALTPP